MTENSTYAEEIQRIREDVGRLLARAVKIEKKAREKKEEAKLAFDKVIVSQFDTTDSFEAIKHFILKWEKTDLQRKLEKATEDLENVQDEAYNLTDVVKIYYMRYT